MRMLVVSPHPDDETLGAGGTILRFMERYDVFWMNVTSVRNSPLFSEERVRIQEEQIKKVKDFYGFKGYYGLGIPSSTLDTYDSGRAIQSISNVMKEVQPELILLPDFNDAHSDHKKVFEWCLASSKVFRHPYVKTIMTMEILSETDFGRPNNLFVPTLFVDITDQMDRKLEALKLYSSELGVSPFPRSIERIKALGVIRGGQAGVQYAEAFRLIKCIY